MKYSKYILIIFFSAFLFSCNNSSIIETKENLPDDFEKLNQNKIIRAITQNNSTDYFIYKGEPMGFQYELLSEFANYLGYNLEIIVSNDLTNMFESLNKDNCDIIAVNLTKTKERIELINFSYPIMQTRQVLVQRKPENWQSMSHYQIDKLLIRNLTELGNKKVHIQKGSSFVSRLKNVSDEIGEEIDIIEVEDYETEEIISLLSKGEYDFTVCDENVALVNQTYYPNIDIKTHISFNQNIAWGVRKNSSTLLDSLNSWISEFKATKKYKGIYNKYFRNNKSVNIMRSEYFAYNTGKVSNYDDLLKNYSDIIKWDWKLLASLIYQESKFIHDLKSWAGAFGIMQLTPQTAERFGVDTLSSPEESILAGVKYIKWISEQLADIEDEKERIKFTLAAYNVGLGHVYDARRLAEKNGKNPNIWENNVDYYLLHKSNPKYYRDSVVKHGYCRGEEPYLYVSEVLNRYEHYKNIVKE